MIPMIVVEMFQVISIPPPIVGVERVWPAVRRAVEGADP
jgi:hypothetical protein